MLRRLMVIGMVVAAVGVLAGCAPVPSYPDAGTSSQQLRRFADAQRGVERTSIDYQFSGFTKGGTFVLATVTVEDNLSGDARTAVAERLAGWIDAHRAPRLHVYVTLAFDGNLVALGPTTVSTKERMAIASSVMQTAEVAHFWMRDTWSVSLTNRPTGNDRIGIVAEPSGNPSPVALTDRLRPLVASAAPQNGYVAIYSDALRNYPETSSHTRLTEEQVSDPWTQETKAWIDEVHANRDVVGYEIAAGGAVPHARILIAAATSSAALVPEASTQLGDVEFIVAG